MVKTRIVKVSKGFYPVLWVPSFLWGGEWRIIWKNGENSFYTMGTMKDEYLCSTEEEADKVIEEYTMYIQDREKVFGR